MIFRRRESWILQKDFHSPADEKRVKIFGLLLILPCKYCFVDVVGFNRYKSNSESVVQTTGKHDFLCFHRAPMIQCAKHSSAPLPKNLLAVSMNQFTNLSGLLRTLGQNTSPSAAARNPKLELYSLREKSLTWLAQTDGWTASMCKVKCTR